ncbi:hypothetical protein TTRE_0000169901 [Trichuris trichiura]|uniref:Protein quiver n=1 Tax=Trichuris trichiura TaxID=36087 RepID=A0A077Z0B6_TRITR|nr:hypothetical protein TTRE_0000169901 [Trichuris trichiura]
MMEVTHWFRTFILLMNIILTEVLKCNICSIREGIDQAVTSDNLRIVTDLRRPYCRGGHEEIECNGYQDACIKMVVYLLDEGKYWLAKGCTNRMPFVPAGCHQTQTEMQEVGMDRLFRSLSGTAMQDVCICETNNCNASFLPGRNIFKIFLPMALFYVWYY